MKELLNNIAQNHWMVLLSLLGTLSWVVGTIRSIAKKTDLKTGTTTLIVLLWFAITTFWFEFFDVADFLDFNTEYLLGSTAFAFLGLAGMLTLSTAYTLFMVKIYEIIIRSGKYRETLYKRQKDHLYKIYDIGIAILNVCKYVYLGSMIVMLIGFTLMG